MSFVFAPGCAMLIFGVARYRNIVTRMLSWRPVVALGNASYSIYLLHMVVFTWLSVSPTPFSYGNLAARLTKLVFAFALLFIASMVVYSVFEVPARRWIRQRFSIQDEHVWRPQLRINAARLIVSGIILLPILSFAYVLERSARRAADDSVATSASSNRIHIVSAMYGVNCTQQPVDAKRFVQRHCDNREACDYVVSVAILGDPAPRCAKDFRVTWRCLPEGPVENVSVPAEAGFHGIAHVRCPAAVSREFTQSP